MRRFIVFLKNFISIPLRVFSNISILSIIQDSTISKKAAICSGTKFYRSSLGEYSYVGRNCFITNTKINKFTSIGEGCHIGGTSHPLNWVSTSPVFHKWDNLFKKNFSRHDFDIFVETSIGNDVWIGTNVLIKAGVNVSDGAVLGMGAVVTKDVGPYEIWGGNPAKLIKKRFDEKTIKELMNKKWWNYEDELLVSEAKKFNDINGYLNK